MGWELFFPRQDTTHTPDSAGKNNFRPHFTDPDSPPTPLHVDLTVDGATTQPAIRQMPASSRCIS